MILLIMAAGCQTSKKTPSVHYPPLPGKPPKIESSQPIIHVPFIPPHPDEGKERRRKRKKDPPDQKQSMQMLSPSDKIR